MTPHLDFSPVDSYLGGTGDKLSPQDALERIGPLPGHGRVSDRTILRWRREGLDLWRADQVAVALGLCPCDLWGQDWCDAIDAWVESWMEQRPGESVRKWQARIGADEMVTA